ncbi:hypothetical protein FACS1894184_04720 [Clostridia bacterium]|nr:hypothetical protein FACS1894184_04720 [Clostridia bacterium]
MRIDGECDGGYISVDESIAPLRFDGAHRTSDRARKAVAQRILNRYSGPPPSRGRNIHWLICYALECGVLPEILEDAIKDCANETQLNLALDVMLVHANDIASSVTDRTLTGRASNVDVYEAISRSKGSGIMGVYA